MIKVDYLLFDLDGTLTDPKEGITRSVQYALNSFGIQVEHLDELCPFIGPPLRESFMEFYGMSLAEAERALVKFREYFTARGMLENQVYSGMEKLLCKLQGQNIKLYVATSKPEVYARKILHHFNLEQYFTFIGGGTLDGQREDKADVIRYVIEQGHIENISKAVMVGDRKFDIIGAKKNQLKSIGVLYGYGDREELEMEQPDYLAATVNDLDLLLS